MVKILANLPAAVQAAQAATTIPAVTQIAQQALASTAKLTDATKSLAAWKLDAAGNLLVRAADGSYLPLDELMNGPLLPRIVELGNLREKCEVLYDTVESRTLSAVVDFRVEKLTEDLSPAEIVQMALRPEAHDFGGDIEIAIPSRLAGPGGVAVDFDDVLNNTTYPSVKERLAWQTRGRELFMEEKTALAAFCRQKTELLAQKMTEAEAVQFNLIRYRQRPCPEVTLSIPERFTDATGQAWTPAQLKRRPLTGAVSAIRKLLHRIERSGPGFELAKTVAEEARLAIEGRAAACQVSRLLAQLSDAELFQLAML